MTHGVSTQTDRDLFADSLNDVLMEVRRIEREKQEPLDLSFMSIAMALTQLRELKDPLERTEYARNNPCAATLLCRHRYLQAEIDPLVIYDIASRYAEKRNIIEPCEALLENTAFWDRSVNPTMSMAYWQNRLKTLISENSPQKRKDISLSETDFFKPKSSSPSPPRLHTAVVQKLFGGCVLL